MTATLTKATSGDMIAMLRKHYIADESRPAGIFAPEIAAPASNRRADLIWQGVTASSGSELHGHEVKVSRSDLLSELADPTKSDPWQRYCDRWWLVIPDPKLIEGLDLPPTWGVLAPPSGRRTRSCTVVVKAPKLNPREQAPALRTIATWLHWSQHRAKDALAHRDGEIDRLRQALRDAQLSGARLQVPEVERRRRDVVDGIVRALGHVGPDSQIGWISAGHVTADDVVAALQDLQKLNGREAEAQGRAKRAVRDMERVSKELARSLAQLKSGAA